MSFRFVQPVFKFQPTHPRSATRSEPKQLPARCLPWDEELAWPCHQLQVTSTGWKKKHQWNPLILGPIHRGTPPVYINFLRVSGSKRPHLVANSLRFRTLCRSARLRRKAENIENSTRSTRLLLGGSKNQEMVNWWIRGRQSNKLFVSTSWTPLLISVQSASSVVPARRQMKPSQETRRKIKSQRVKHTPGQQSELFVWKSRTPLPRSDIYMAQPEKKHTARANRCFVVWSDAFQSTGFVVQHAWLIEFIALHCFIDCFFFSNWS